MSKLRLENELELGGFGDYLLKSRIVPEKYARTPATSPLDLLNG